MSVCCLVYFPTFPSLWLGSSFSFLGLASCSAMTPPFGQRWPKGNLIFTVIKQCSKSTWCANIPGILILIDFLRSLWFLTIIPMGSTTHNFLFLQVYTTKKGCVIYFDTSGICWGYVPWASKQLSELKVNVIDLFWPGSKGFWQNNPPELQPLSIGCKMWPSIDRFHFAIADLNHYHGNWTFGWCLCVGCHPHRWDWISFAVPLDISTE